MQALMNGLNMAAASGALDEGALRETQRIIEAMLSSLDSDSRQPSATISRCMRILEEALIAVREIKGLKFSSLSRPDGKCCRVRFVYNSTPLDVECGVNYPRKSPVVVVKNKDGQNTRYSPLSWTHEMGIQDVMAMWSQNPEGRFKKDNDNYQDKPLAG